MYNKVLLALTLALVLAPALSGCLPELKIPLGDLTTDSSITETGADSGTTDSGCELVWYADRDGDGYGDVGSTQVDCDQPSGYVDNATDCDDADAVVNPGAVEVCTDLVDLNCDGAITGVDADNDGYTACEDCNDTDGGVSPSGIEICDGVDNDCSGSVDGSDAIDATTWYADADSDGYGRTDVTEVACTAPSGYTEKDGDCDDGNAAYNPGAEELDCSDPIDYNCDGSVGYDDADTDGFAACEDCNDSDATVFPDATETCNSNDDNCDGNVDEDLEEFSYYHDADGDGYGNVGVETSTCDTAAPVGYVDNGDDCDDADALAYPSAPEDCTSSDDLNCDGSAGGDDADGDSYRSCEECDDSKADISPDAVEMCDGVDNDCDGATDGSDAIDATAWYTDADGDEYGGGSAAYSCEEPSGAYADNDDDCDDGSRWVNPAATEDCDAIDNNCDGEVNEGGICDTGTPLDTGTPVDTGGGDTASGGDSGGKDTSGGSDTGTPLDTADTGTVDTGGELYSTDFGDGGTCSTDPWVRSDGGSMAYASYASGSECGVYVFGSGSASGPSIALSYSASGYTEGVEYTVTMTVENVVGSSVTFYTDFGGGTIVSEAISSGGTATVTVSWTADSSGSATIQAWTGYSTNYGLVIEDLTITY